MSNTLLGAPKTSKGSYRSEYYTEDNFNKRRRERWRNEMKQKLNNNIHTYESICNPKVTVGDSMRVDVPLVVDGRDVMKEIDEMRDVLLLLKRDVDMESKYPKLKELKNAYEAQLKKYKTFEALK